MKRAILACAIVFCGCSNTAPVLPPLQKDALDPGADTVAESGPDLLASPKTLRFVITSDDLGKNCVGQSSCNLILAYFQEREVAVRVESGGVPVPGVRVTFAITEDPDKLGKVEPGEVQSDAAGLATVKIASILDRVGSFRVSACVKDEPATACLTFHVTTDCKCDPGIEVRFAPHDGIHPQADTGHVVIFAQGADGKPRCGNLAVLGVNPAATVVLKDFPITETGFFAQPASLTEDQRYTVLGTMHAGKGPALSWGCDDTTAKLSPKNPQRVQVVLVPLDLTPALEGTYLSTSTFDVSQDLSPSAAAGMDAIATWASNPASETLALMCKLSDGQPALANFCKKIFKDAANPIPSKLTQAGLRVQDAAMKGLASLLATACPLADPAQCQQVWWTAADVRSMLTRLRVSADLVLKEASDPLSGKVTGPGTEEWHTLSARWIAGSDCKTTDESCGWLPLPLAQVEGFGTPTSKADILFEVASPGKMTIGVHSVTLRFGLLAAAAVERVWFPKVLSPAKDDGVPRVDAFDRAIAGILGGRACLKADTCCDDFAVAVTEPYSGLSHAESREACVAVRTAGASWLRKRLTDLDEGVSDLLLQSKAPCTVRDEDADMKADGLGTVDAPCLWDARWRIGGATSKPDAGFFASGD